MRRLALIMLVGIALAGCGRPSAGAVHAAQQDCTGASLGARFGAGGQLTDPGLSSPNPSLSPGPPYSAQDLATCMRSARDRGKADPHTLRVLKGTAGSP